MEYLTNILKLSAGVGLFVFAMYLIEEALKNLSGRNFKIFLQKVTKNKITAVAGGAIVTGILQSSSMVSLMVLAFVGAGVFAMKDAMALILGANLGTTLDSWIVATLGFKMNIEVAAYPAVCIGGLLLIIFGNKISIKYIAYFILGFGLLFIGLSFMKTAMEAEVQHFDFSKYAGMPLIVFLFIGFCITLLIQSSSVTMALTLSALHAGALTFPFAVAIVLGSETGTTIKIMLSAIGGNASKKRVVLGNILFNIILTVLAFIFLKQILYLITDVFNIKDPLIGLVTFSSLVNLLSIILFLPILNNYANFLERFFKDTDETTAAFINHANIAEPETALDLLRRETRYFIHNACMFNLSLFEIDTHVLEQKSEFEVINSKRKFYSKTESEKYDFLKQLQGEIQAFYLKIREKVVETNQLNQLISSSRSCMHAVKSMKDIAGNINNLKRSSKDIKFDFFLQHKKVAEKFYKDINELLIQTDKIQLDRFQAIYNEIETNYNSSLEDFYTAAQQSSIESIDLTTALNFNREFFTSNKAMLMSVKDYLLDEKEGEAFNEFPVYQT
ncbi:Na/Pi cotransporter family protein [soil metagenome]